VSKFHFPPEFFSLDERGEKFSLNGLSRLTGATERQIRYYVSIGAIDPPTGRTRAAYYTPAHVEQVRYLRSAADQGRTALEAAEAMQLGLKRGRSRPAQANAPSAWTDGMQVRHRYWVTENIWIDASAKLMPIERRILQRLRQAAKLTLSDRGALIESTVDQAVGSITTRKGSKR
jgi:DNA-binding transcriptional MerR regulator